METTCLNRRAIVRAIAAAATAGAGAAAAADWTNPFARAWRDSFLRHWRDEKEYTLAVLEAMPDEAFDSKPNPAQRTFGEQLVHLGRANAAYFTAFGLLPAPEPPKGADKETVRKYVTASFDYVTAVLEKITEKDLLRTDLGSPPRYPAHSGTDLCLRAYTHTAHHRGQAVVYLRVRGITPPAWKFEPTVG
jgi:uncharacterized damage-inducible protein DinB